MSSERIKLAIVVHAPAPYRIAQHRRIVHELGDEVELCSIFMHEHNWQPWKTPLPEEINPIVFGRGEHGKQFQKSLRGWWHEWRKMREAIDWIKKNRVDAVITAGYHDLGLLRLILWCHRSGLPNFMFSDSNVYGDQPRGWRRYAKSRYVSWIVSKLTGLMPCGTYGRQYFHRYGGANKPAFFVPHEPDYAKIFTVTGEQRNGVREKFHIRADCRYFVYSGRLAKVKRVDTLIDAFAKIAGQRPDWDLLIIGGGDLSDELHARVPTELEQRIVWTGFIEEADELSALYACGDVFVLPSSYEPWAVVVCEAAAAGLAIVASRVVGAAGELCREGVNGQLFTPGDVDGLATALLDVTTSDERVLQLRRGSLQVLDEWRRRGDPVEGIRQALVHVGLLPPRAPREPNPPTPTIVERQVAAS